MRNNQKELHSSQSTESICSRKWEKGATCSLSNVNNVTDFYLNYIAKRKGKFCWRLPCHQLYVTFLGSRRQNVNTFYSCFIWRVELCSCFDIPNWSICLELPKFLWEKCINVLLYGKQLYTCSSTMLLEKILVISKAPLWKLKKTSTTIHLTIKQYFFQFNLLKWYQWKIKFLLVKINLLGKKQLYGELRILLSSQWRIKTIA